MSANLPGREVIRQAVDLARRAPSLHNSQPWRWVADETTLQLWADPRRRMPGTDPSGRELTLSCGAVLDHVRVAMAAAGWGSITERLPNAHDPAHLATLRFRPAASIAAPDQRLAQAIRRRHTDRLPYAAPSPWSPLEAVLRDAVTPYGVSLDVIADDQRPRLAEVSRLTETLRRYDTTYLTELRWWASPFESDASHVPQSSLVSASEAARVDIGRAFPPTGGGHRRPTVDHDHSKIVVLSTRRDETAEVLRCGEALSAVLLECTAAGMATCTLTHLTELEHSRAIIGEITGTSGRPQLLIRVGRSPAHEHPAETTPRRPMSEVLDFVPGSSAADGTSKEERE
ncbi:NAD(P)H nitroreductase [Mycobacterium asiaticum]|uniref:NAD(P)H nitroreductase n=1 Tax=Mycobacterium asiaticum TaxID=1790 RepID=A0A1A3P785_MYCAS|nr:NAD(P)H nitroreductase [Mycobacterium asiaticum]OBK29169.1 NAD(P)H nitroreductase [Mycobacterium asiaticum]